jgi:hypothetical protein
MRFRKGWPSLMAMLAVLATLSGCGLHHLQAEGKVDIETSEEEAEKLNKED